MKVPSGAECTKRWKKWFKEMGLPVPRMTSKRLAMTEPHTPGECDLCRKCGFPPKWLCELIARGAEGMLGYCSKDMGKPHYKSHQHGVSDEEVEAGQEVYAIEGGKNVKGMVPLDKKNLLSRMLHFWKMKMQSEGGLRVDNILLKMIHPGYFYPSAEFTDSRGAGIDRVRARDIEGRMCM